MVEECASRGIHLASGDAFRNMPQHWKVKPLIDSGELGEIRGRFFNKKEVMSPEQYTEQIKASAGKPMGGAIG